MVLHEAGDLIACRLGSGEEHQLALRRTEVVFVAIHYDFFSPVAKDVGLKAGCCFSVIACGGMAIVFKLLKGADGLVGSAVVLYAGGAATSSLVQSAVEGLVEGISCPVDAEVDVWPAMEEHSAVFACTDGVFGNGPEFVASMGGYEVGCKTSSVVLMALGACQSLSCGGVVDIIAVGRFFVGHHYL